jgi:predicted dehydrogenase
MTVRIAFAGTGYIAKIHARAAGKVEGVELAAVVNHRPGSMAAFAGEFGIGRQYATVEEMLAKGGVDALVVSTPNCLHAPQTIAALEAGVHVMVEKPMAMNAAEAGEMVAAGQRSGALLMVAHCWRFDQEARWVAEQVAAGRIGEVIRTRGCGVHVNWGPGGWFTQKREAGGGAVADMGIHAIDTARFLMGDPQPVSVFARIGTYYREIDVDDTGVIAINWDNGAVVAAVRRWTECQHPTVRPEGDGFPVPHHAVDTAGGAGRQGRAGGFRLPGGARESLSAGDVRRPDGLLCRLHSGQPDTGARRGRRVGQYADRGCGV